MQTELANTSERSLSTIDGLAAQARALRLSINLNMWQLARVFIEAKELVPRGEWEQWLKDNADVSVRTAQDLMAAYRRFGDNPQFEGLGQAKVFKMLPLPEGTEGQFLAEHDVSTMSTREVQEAVKKAREEAQAAIDAAERRAREAESNAEEADARAADRYTQEFRRMEREIAEKDDEILGLTDDLRDKQKEYDALQERLLNEQSTTARRDAERPNEKTLTAESFAAAVHTFLGVATHVSYMADEFSTMPPDQLRKFADQVKRVKIWVARSEEAINTIRGEVITVE